jgi:hypothetical protein
MNAVKSNNAWRMLLVITGIVLYRKSSLYLGRNLDIVFYPREGCLLCDEFEVLLQASPRCRGLQYERIDIDRNPKAQDRFGKRIPVLEIEDFLGRNF